VQRNSSFLLEDDVDLLNVLYAAELALEEVRTQLLLVASRVEDAR
jgi:hypothetical protein